MKAEIFSTDVLVVGAGPSGVPAAVAAARNGAKVILIDEDTLPGGAPVDMYVAMTCGGPRGGIYSEMLSYLNDNHTLDMNPIIPFNNGEDGCNHWWTPYSYVDAIMHVITNEPNITLVTGAKAEEVISEKDPNGNILVNGVKIIRGPHLAKTEIRAKVVIDATGTGILGDLAGCDVRYGADSKSDFGEEFAPDERNTKVMPCTLQYITQRLTGKSMPKKEEFSVLPTRSGFVEDKLYNWSSAAYDEAVRRNVGIYLHWGATVQCEDTRDPVLLGMAHIKALKMIYENARLWYRYGFTINIAPKLGVRECRRVMGDYVLTLADMLEGKFQYDTVAVSSYGVDLWGSGKNPDGDINKMVKTYGIPYRALIPSKTEGLLIAGRCISGSRIACSSYRVQPIVASIGEAAGTAAALSALSHSRTREIRISDLQAKLQISGVLSGLF